MLPANLRGTTSNAFIHISDWYATLTKLVGVDGSDKRAGVPDTDGIDQVITQRRAHLIHCHCHVSLLEAELQTD